MSDKRFPEKLNYRIGLDIGIASVGWAVLENNSNDEPIRIVDLGVRLFDKAEIPKTGESLAGPRRMARTTRRRLRRRKHRLDRIKWLLQQEDLIDIETFMKRYHSANLPDVYKLRYEALDRKLKDEELAQVLIHIAKHRGFKSTRKAETMSKENGAVLKATSANEVLMKEKGYRTVGEMLYCDPSFKVEAPWTEDGYRLAIRNTTDDYRHTILRSMLVEEVHTIFESQRTLGNVKATEELERKYLEIMESQRSFDLGPGKQPNGKPSPYAIDGFGDRVGKCTLEPEEMRAAKATYTAELFVVLQKINNLRLVDKHSNGRELTKEERELLIELVHSQKEIKYSTVRSKLKIGEEYRFNLLNYSAAKKDGDVVKATENTKFISMPFYYEISSERRLGKLIAGMPEDEIASFMDRVGTILTLYKNDDSRSVRFRELGMEDGDIEKILDMSPVKFQHISLKAMQKMIPYLKEGMTYDKACEAAGYDFKVDNNKKKSKILKGEEIQNILNDITNPVVKRSVSQTIKVVNAIIRKFGSPQAINIELAREMSKTFDERNKLKKQMDERFAENDKIKKQIQELGQTNPTGQDILKYRLWIEQQGYCVYSGKQIPLEELFAPGYDIDHILPYSMTFDDSFRNKVLVTSQENRQKGNRTPYEYFGHDEKRWVEFEARVSNFVKDYKKQQKLLKKHFTEEERKQFKERNLNDTKYITRVVYNMIRQNLELAPYNREGHKKQVMAVNGAVTAFLRKRWGIQKLFEQKNRDIDVHHAVDAVVIACCTDGMINRITRSVQAREIAYAMDTKFIDYETGEILDRAYFTKDEWDEKFGIRIARPWPWFMDELQVRLGDDPIEFLKSHSDVNRQIDYPEWMLNEENKVVRPIFVSRMPNHKVTGAAHADTVRSPRHYKEKGTVLTRTALTDLKLNKDGEIEGYYNKESDWLLYNALKRQLLLYNNDAKKAFAEPFHKPKADGSEGPVVNKVKIETKLSYGVMVNDGNGVSGSSQGSMVRVDIFREKGKYYAVPVYVADTVRKRLPNKAAVAHKPYSEWKQMDDNNFLFSLYRNDLIKIASKDGINIKYQSGVTAKKEGNVFAYFGGINIANANMSGKAHDSNYEFGSQGIQRLTVFEKYQVDVLGNISKVNSEKRMTF